MNTSMIELNITTTVREALMIFKILKTHFQVKNYAKI